MTTPDIPLIQQRKPDPEMIQITIGLAGDVKTIHKNILVANSGYFEKALTGTWTEAASGSLNLVDEDPVIFAIFEAWLYQGDLFFQIAGHSTVTPQLTTVKTEDFVKKFRPGHKLGFARDIW